MALYNLHFEVNHRPHSFPIGSHMSLIDIKQTVGKCIGISTDAFEIQVREEHGKNYYVLDDEFVENLQQQLPRTSISTLFGDILVNKFILSSYVLNQCDKDTKLNRSDLDSSSEGIIVDYENSEPEEVSAMQHQEDDPECFKKLLAPIPEEKTTGMCLSHELDYSINPAQQLNRMDSMKPLPSNDEIKKNICHPDASIIQENSTSFDTDDNELHSHGIIDLEAQAVVQKVVDIVIKHPNDIGANPVESFGTEWQQQHSDYLSSHLPDQISQQTPSVKLSPSLEFVHDVHPFQRTQHNTDSFDQCTDKNIPPYVMRIQGFKTNADKGKSVLPKIKVPPFYISSYQQQERPVYLMIALVREEKVNDKRVLYACKDMCLLPPDTKGKTKSGNPIQMNLQSLPIESDGTLQLALRLVNNSLQSTTDPTNHQLFYELQEEIAESLHPAPYDSKYFRLACTLVKNNTIAWNTLCLSNYIRPKEQLQA